MRTIKFRGQMVIIKKWVYGDLITGQGTKNGNMYILPQTQFYPSGCNDLDGWNVIPETVGQFTGLTDKNGKEIYEGDLCRVWYYKHAEPTRIIIQEVLFDNGTFVLRAKNHLGLELEDYLLYVPLYYSSAPNIIEVIGNIHETQEEQK